MKVCMFHLMPYRDLPADFEQRYNSAYIDPVWFDVADSDKVGQYYNATLDEMLYAAKAGLHGLCTNQHHQNVYGFMANPSLMGAVLARADQRPERRDHPARLDAAVDHAADAHRRGIRDARLHQRRAAGRGLPHRPADRRHASPTASCRSSSASATARRSALVTKAWSAKEIFAWNGKHYQLGMVNLWPRPIQQPHPPIWIPGSGISSTAEYVVDLDHCFCHLSYYGAKNAEQVSDRYWELVARKGRDDNPYRYSFLQLIGVAETDAEAEDLYAAHAEYFFHKLLYTPPLLPAIPGCLEYPRAGAGAAAQSARAINLRELKAKDFFERGFVVVGSPKTVREQLIDGVKRLRIGHLLALLHFGSMPTELCKRNIDLFAREVLPHLDGAVGRQVRGPLVARAPAGASARPPPPWPPPPERGGERPWPPQRCAGSGSGRTGSRPRSRSPAAGRRSSICTGRGASPPTARSSPASPAPTRSMRRSIPAPAAAIPRRCTRSTAGSTSSSITASCSTGWSSPRRRSSAIRSARLVAAEFAAAAPKSVSRLVLIDPVGLWRDDLPVKNWMVLSDKERRPSLFADPEGEAAQRFFAVPSDPAARVDVLAQFIWSQACTGKFVWPIRRSRLQAIARTASRRRR